MYRPQAHHYSQHEALDPYQRRQPEAALFEDSPQNNTSYEEDSNQKPMPQYMRNQKDPHPLNQRLQQSEESGQGGVSGSDRKYGDGEEEDYREEHEDGEMDKEGESDIEFIIMNLYSKMKNLEGKYIDLANFYKQELVKTSSVRKTLDDDQRPISHFAQQRREVTPSKSFERSADLQMDQSPGKVSSDRGDMPSEREIIRDLIEEKKKLEDDMKQMLTMRASQHPQLNFQQSPIKLPSHPISEFQSHQPNAYSHQQIEAAQQNLSEALKEVLSSIEVTQKKELQVLTTKQNEMYSLATRYNLPANIRNESLGLWYDAKTKITQCMSDFKFQVIQKQKDIEGNNQNTGSSRPKIRSKQEAVQSPVSQGQSEAIEKLGEELNAFKRKMNQQQKQMMNLQNSINFRDINLKEEQHKIQQLIKEVQNGLNGLDFGNRKDQLMFSNDKNNNMMSPFEKRIATYQKSAEMRKQMPDPLNRSGSRGRPGYPPSNTGNNFYQSREYLNPQIMAQPPYADHMESNPDSEFRAIKNKLRNVEYTLDDIYTKEDQKVSEQSEMNKMVDQTINETNKFIRQMEQQIKQSKAKEEDKFGKKGGDMDRSKSKSGYQDNSMSNNLTSPNRQNDSNFYSGQRQNLNEKKIAELQRNNDQLFGELRKANEKYLNQRVESNKLKDEVQILQNALQESNSQLKKQQHLLQEQTSLNNSLPRQQIKKKSQATSQRVDQLPSQTLGVTPNRGRQPSNNSLLLTKENEDLKKRVQDLEKECFTLTYYQQELQRRGLPHTMSETQDLKQKIDSLCLKVQRFMFAMKRLQRAVNNKDKDIQIFKTEFELNKKALEQLVKEIKEQMENKQQNFYVSSQGKMNNSNLAGPQQQTNHSMMATWDQRLKQGDNSENLGQMNHGQRNRSQNPHGGNHNQLSSNQSKEQHPIYSISQRQDPTAQPNLNQIRAKNPHQEYYQQPPQPFNDSASMEQEEPQLVVSPSQEFQFNKVLEDVKLLQEETEQQKKLIDQLKQQNETLEGDKNVLDVQLKSKQINSQKLTQQLKASSETIQRQEGLLNDYKDALIQLEAAQNLSRKLVSKLKTDLLMKEKDLIHAQLSQDSSRKSQQTQSQKDLQQELKLQQQIQQAQFAQLKEELKRQIGEKEEEMETHFEQLNSVINEKEEDISRLKKLVFEKLKEIETSFAEISQDMIESESLQQEASRRMISQSQLQQTQMNQQKHDLEKSVEHAIGRIEEDQREEELEQLAQANEELLAQNSQLNENIKKLKYQIEQLNKINDREDEIQGMKEQNEKQMETITQLSTQNQSKDKKIQEQVQEKKNLQAEIKKLTKSIESLGIQYQQTLSQYEDQIEEGQSSLSQEQERRLLFESEFNNKDKLLKQAKAELKVLETEHEQCKVRERELNGQIENLNQEQEYMQTLKKVTGNDSSMEAEPSQFDDAIENAKIEQKPKEQAQSYFKMLKATNKELAILQKNHEKLQSKFNEQKQNMSELKQESRQSFEQVMNLETKIFDFEAENERLTTELNKGKGAFKVDEEAIKLQVEEQFRDQIKFQESEIESLNAKYSRILDSNAELTQRAVRLESNNYELSTENEQMKNRMQSLEMELEMTKSNSERDMDQLLEQEQQKLSIEKTKNETEKMKLQVKLNELIKQSESEKQALAEKIAKKKEKLQNIKNENQSHQQKVKESGFLQESIKKSMEQRLKDMERICEEEKKAREEAELEKQRTELNQHHERENLLKEQEKQKQELLKLHQQELDQEKQKTSQTVKQSSSKEEDLKLQHEQQIIQLEQKLLKEKKELEHDLQINERKKIEALKSQMEKEKEEQVRLKEKEAERLVVEAIKKKEEEAKELLQQFEEEKKELEKINQQEMNLIQVKLMKDSEEQQKKQKKSLSLIQVLQSKARQAILAELETQKKANEQLKLKQADELQKLINNQNQMIQQKEEEKHKDLEDLKLKLEQQKQKDLQSKEGEKTLALKLQEKIREDLQNQLKQQEQDHQSEIEKQKQELARMKQEQEELVKSISLKQDQQTQDLLASKEREKADLLKKLEDQQKLEKESKQRNSWLGNEKKGLEQQIEELESKHALEIEEKKKEIRELIEKNKKTENDLAQQMHVQEEKYKGETETLKKGLEGQINEKERDLEKKQGELDACVKQANTELELLKQKHSKEIKEKQEQIDKVSIELQQQTDQNSALNIQLQKLKQEKEQKLKEKEDLLQSQISKHDSLVKELEQSQQSDIEALKKKLEEDHTSLLKKKDQEKSIFEKMQEKVRNELKEKLEEKEQEQAIKQQVIDNLQKEISQSSKSMEKERVDQQELIDGLNISMKQVGEQKIFLERENEKLKKEVETMKKQQQESEKELIRDLREKLQAKEKQYEEVLALKNSKEQEAAQYKQRVKEKEGEIANLEKDLDQFAKDQDDEKQQNEETQEQLNQKLKELAQQKEALQKEKKESSLLVKMKEGLLKELQEKLTQNEETIREKEDELQRLEETKGQTQTALSKQLKEERKKHQEDLDRLEAEKKQIQEEVEQFKSKKQIECDNISMSVEEIEKKLAQFEIDLSQARSQHKELMKAKQMNESLIEGVKGDKSEEIIGQIGVSEALKYCKRVKYLEKAWILICKSDSYYWVDQEKIPLQKIQRLDVEQLEDASGKLQERLNELTSEKEKIIKMLNESGSMSIEKQKASTQRILVLDRENKDLQDRMHDLENENNSLQKSNLQLKQKINELNDMVFGLTDTDKSHENVKKIYEFKMKNEELSTKLLEQYQISQTLEAELEQKKVDIEKLQKQVSEMDYSFARGQNANSIIKPENFNLNASSIDQKLDEYGNEVGGDSKVQRLETELEEFQKLNIELEKLNKNLKIEISEIKKNSQSQNQAEPSEKEMQDALKHTRGILIKFLEKTPVTVKENEDLLTIIFSMMFFTKEEIVTVQKSRQIQTDQALKAQTKKGVFGMFGKAAK